MSANIAHIHAQRRNAICEAEEGQKTTTLGWNEQSLPLTWIVARSCNQITQAAKSSPCRCILRLCMMPVQYALPKTESQTEQNRSSAPAAVTKQATGALREGAVASIAFACDRVYTACISDPWLADLWSDSNGRVLILFNG